MSAMNCKQARNLFDSHLDGELTGELATEMAAHLLQCSDCRHELALQEVAGRVLQNDRRGEPGASEDFTDRLMACIDESPDIHVMQERQKWRVPWRVAGPIAAMAACIGIVIMVFPERKTVIDGVKETPTGTVIPADKDTDPISLDEAARALKESFENAVNQTREDVSSIGEASRRSMEKTLDALNTAVEETNSNGENENNDSEDSEPVEDF